MLVRIVSALAIGHVVFFGLMITLPLRTGMAVSEIVSLCISAVAFPMLRVRHWRFWVAVVIGAVLWFATMILYMMVLVGMRVTSDCHCRHIGLMNPLPDFR